MKLHDPRPRKDGKCAVCRKPLNSKPRPGINPSYYETDPFCSASCCRTWHGVRIGTGPS